MSLLGSAVVFGIGYQLHNKVYDAVTRTNMNLTKMGNYADNLKACIRGIYELLGAITTEDIQALSMDGILYCIKVVFVTAVLTALFCQLKTVFKGKDARLFNLNNYLAFLFVWNFLVLFLADARFSGNNYTEYRYFLIGLIPLFILFGMKLSELNGVFNDFQKGIAHVVLFMFLAIMVLGNNKYIVDHWDRSTYAVEFCEYVDTLNVDSVIFLDDKDSALFCKGIDNDHKYGAYKTDTQSFHVGGCSYSQSAYGAYYGEKHALAVISGTNIYDCLPAEIADSYQYVETFKWFEIYISDEMLFP